MFAAILRASWRVISFAADAGKLLAVVVARGDDVVEDGEDDAASMVGEHREPASIGVDRPAGALTGPVHAASQRRRQR
jgi:hypothetical protein